MNAHYIISSKVTPLRPEDNYLTAISFLEELKLYHIPLVNGKEFLGLISEKEIYEATDLEQKLSENSPSLKNNYVSSNDHILDVFKEMGRNNLDCIAVLNENQEFTGCITYESIFEHFFGTGVFIQDGCVLVIELNQRDYSMSQIANIVESNDAKILFSSIIQIPESKKILLNIKINLVDPSRILSAFERYNYNVTVYLSEENTNNNLIEERYNELMNYLNV